MFYIACLVAFLILARRAKSPGDSIVRVVIQFIIGFWLLLPMFLVDVFEEVADGIPVDLDVVRRGYLVEAAVLLAVSLGYLAITEGWWRWLWAAKQGDEEADAVEPKERLGASFAAATRDVRFAYGSGALVLVSIGASLLFPATYEEINAVGSKAGIGGKFGLPLIEPLFVAYLFAYFIFNSRRNQRVAWVCFALVSAKAAVSALEGARIVLLFPILMLYGRRVIENGRYLATLWLLRLAVLLFPAGALLLVVIAELRVGGEFSLEALGGMTDVLGLVALQFFIKSSSVVHAAVLLDSGPTVTAAQAASAMYGALVFFVPRFFWRTKPISGSIDGTEGGLPYRIAADLLGYPDWGNVGLSPFLTSYWILGVLGVATAAAIMIGNLLLARRFLESDASKRTVLGGIAFYAVGVPHMTGLWVDFSAGCSMLLHLLFMGGLVHFYLLWQQAALADEQVAGSRSRCPDERW